MVAATDRARAVVTLPATQAFEEFYRSEWRRVLGLVYALSGSSWGAEDIAQEAFVRAHRDWERVSRFDYPGAWVRTVAINLARSRLRRAAAEVRALRRWLGMQPAAFPPLEPPAEDFWRAVRALPPRQRTVVALHYADDLSVHQIAEALGVADSTVKTSLQKGRATLASRLDETEVAP